MLLIRITKKFRAILSRRQKTRIIELAVLMVIGGLLETFSVSLVLPFISAVMEPEKAMQKWYAKLICAAFHLQIPRTFLVVVAVLLAAVYIIKNIYLLFEYNIQYRFVYGNMLAMQSRVLDSYLHRPYEDFLQLSSGELLRVITKDVTNTFTLLLNLLGVFTELVVSVMLGATVFMMARFITFCMAIMFAILLLVVSYVIKPRLRRIGLTQQRTGTAMNKWLMQSVQGIKEVKITGKEDYFQNNFESNGSEYVGTLRKSQILGITPRFLIEAFSMSTMFLVVAFLIYRGGSLEALIPMLTAVGMAAIRLLPAVNRIISGIATAAQFEPMLDKLIESLDAMEGNGASLDGLNRESGKAEKNADIEPLRNEIDFREISFRYPDAETEVLSDASMTIRRGEAVGVVGGSGAGKTTAIDILLGLLKPQNGQVLVDGTSISADMRGWHEQIGYIPQMIFMLDDTIRNNICFGEREEDISDDKVWQALEEASLADFVKALPDGLDTQIGERGIRLSGGQRQRIGIARALYRDPAVLVFDEATSALDNETEAEIMKSINHLQGQKTMLIIAHRLTTIENCDHVYRVENGKITQER